MPVSLSERVALSIKDKLRKPDYKMGAIHGAEKRLDYPLEMDFPSLSTHYLEACVDFLSPLIKARFHFM
jgi:hypothetical protein